MIKPTLPQWKNFNEYLAYKTNKRNSVIIFLKLDTKEGLEGFYNLYPRSLRRAQQKLVEFYAYALKICWAEKSKNEYQKFLDDYPYKNAILEYIVGDKVDSKEEEKNDGTQTSSIVRPKDLFKTQSSTEKS